MTDETDTPLDSGTDSVTPENDTAEDWDYFDPDDEEQDTEEPQEPDATDEGAEEEPAAPEEPDPPAPVQLTLPDGTQVTVDEAAKGYLRQADYTRKLQDVSQRRQAVEADLQRIEGITNAVVDHLTGMLPPAPDASLAMRDPQAYVRQKAQYDAAIEQLRTLIDLGGKPKEIKEGWTAQQRQEVVAQENAKLAERFPEITQPGGREKFFTRAADAAQAAGFTMQDLQGVTDHRLFALAALAAKGMEAEKARATAKAKVANVPPAAPAAPVKPGNPVQQRRKPLPRSMSLKQAMQVDFD